MGGSSYDIDVGYASEGKSYSRKSEEEFSYKTKAHSDVLISNQRRVFTDAKNPIVIALDVTGSMGDSAKIMFDKMPMFWGQIEQKGYLEDPAVSFAAIGDAYFDEAPLQVTQFEKAKAIHEWLKKIWLEGRGGSGIYESYELAALFYTANCDLPNLEHAFFFFIGDEGFYTELDGNSTIPIFEKLLQIYDTYFIHWPYKSPGADAKIVKQWKDIMGQRFLTLKDPKAIVDVMLGLINISMGNPLSDYEEELKTRGQSDFRIKVVHETISHLEKNAIVKVDTALTKKENKLLLKNRDPFRKRI